MSSSYAPCAACKYLRRKCTQECVFAPYFPPDIPQKFINVHKVFGASNVGKILNELSPAQRNDAVNSLAYEAECRIKDPIYGCVGLVSLLQHHLRQVHHEIDRARKELATYIGPAAMQSILVDPTAMPPPPPPPHGFNVNSSAYQPPPPYHGPLLIQEPQPQMEAMAAAAAATHEQEMIRAYAQQQQQQQLFYVQQQHELYVQERRLHLQHQQNELARLNDSGRFGHIVTGAQAGLALGGGGSVEAPHYHYQSQQAAQGPQIQELLIQQPQQIIPHQFGRPQGPHAHRDGGEEEKSFGPL